MRLVTTLVFFLSIQLRPFFGQDATTNPVLLTGKSHEAEKHIDYRAPDQCLPYMMDDTLEQDAKTTFGISFRLPNHGGRCDDGLLICYPGALDGITAGDNWPNMLASKQFKVGNDQNDNIATLKCTKRWRTDGNGEGFVWHGIHVYTQSENGTDNQKIVRMKMSISPEEYNFGSVRQFSIHFGNRVDPFTYVTVDDGIPFINQTDNAFRTNFLLRAIRKGAFLSDFVGLWMLGLDMLPFNHLHNIELYTYRGCNCTLEAWFTKPTDVEEPPRDFDVSAGGSENCNHSISRQRFSISKVPKGHNTKDFGILINALTDDNLTEIVVQLKDANNDNIMEFTIGPNWPLSVTLPGEKESAVDVTMPNGSYAMYLWIDLYKNSFGIRLNNSPLMGNRQFWPINWWQGSGRERIENIVLTGQMLLLEKPATYKIQTAPNVPLNYTKFYRTMCNGSIFLFRVRLIGSGEFGEFNISLLHDRPEHHDKLGSTVFEVEVIPRQYQFIFTNFHYGNKISAFKYYEFNRNQLEFEFKIQISNDYRFFLNGRPLYTQNENITPAWAINFVRVEGVVELLEEPIVNKSECVADAKKGLTKELTSLLNYGETVRIVGQANQAKIFNIYLLHEASVVEPRMGDVPLRLEFNSENSTINCTHWIYSEHTWRPGKNAMFTSLKMFPTQHFELEILMGNDGFYGNISKTGFIKLCDYYVPQINKEKAIMPFPPFAIDHIRVEGDLNVSADQIWVIQPRNNQIILDQNKTKIDYAPIPYKQINRTNGLLQVNESVIVQMELGQFVGKKHEVCVFFYNEALAYHDLIGKTVLKILLDEEKLEFSRHYPRNWSKKFDNKNGQLIKEDFDNKTVQMKNKLKPYTALSFTITVKGTFAFELLLEIFDGTDKAMDGKSKKLLFNETNVFTQTDQAFLPPLPAWAAHYITTNHTVGVTLLSQRVFCVPENRCTKRNGEMAYQNNTL